ncbi:MAG: phosphate ABC transporter ATP-binding protein [Firmicutes bacterium]|nr:phosphate ABC transporter ATP-binding protein [Bacillota bacterium]
MPPKIKISNFNFYYGDTQAIKDLNLTINENRILSIIGPANSGITTLLRSLNRLSDLSADARHEGEIFLNGEEIFNAEYNVVALRRKVGFVFDVPTPLNVSIFDNVAYGARLMRPKKTKSELAELVEQSLIKAALWDEVKDRLKAPGMSLSGGQQQRLCVARVLALNPEVILLDRPCSGLDPISTAKIEESLSVLKESLTVVIAPHSTQQAIRISDDVAFMLKGELIEDGVGAQLFARPQDPRTQDYIAGKFG